MLGSEGGEAGEGEAMLEDLESMKKDLIELAEVVNSFTSEAVQLRVVELLLGEWEHAEDQEVPNPRKRNPKKGRRKPKPLDEQRDAQAAKANGKPRARSASRRTGPSSALATLFAGGFFKTPRTLKAIVDHCEQNLASKYKQSDFSGKIGRYVRDGKLTRAKNGDKQYEYTNA